jgi:hypothetical protein
VDEAVDVIFATPEDLERYGNSFALVHYPALWEEGRYTVPAEDLAPDDPREWLARAAGNLRIARSRIPGVDLAELCFNAHRRLRKPPRRC